MRQLACMTTEHANGSRLSPCCQAPTSHHGGRRRQCRHCLETWSIRKKKRGRKQIRASPTLVGKYLSRSLPSLEEVAKQRGCSPETVRRRLAASRDRLLRSIPWKSSPHDTRLIALADGMEVRIEKTVITVYLILLKPLGSPEAIICPPHIVRGREDGRGWMAAFSQLPRDILMNICALVCDGKSSLKGAAIEHHWLLQRCHFHLLHSIGNYLSGGGLSRTKILSFLVHRSVRMILTTEDPTRIERNKAHLAELLPFIRSRGLRKVLIGFLRYTREYRTYLRHPHLDLPTTSNACESLIQCLRDVCYRARGFRSLSSFKRWVIAILKHKQVMKVNGHQPQN